MTVSADALDFPHMQWIDIKNVHFPSTTVYQSMQELHTLCIYASTYDDFNGLDALRSLSTIYCTSAQQDAIESQYPDAIWRLILTE